MYQQEIELWGLDEDIHVFRSNTGRRIEAYRDAMNVNDAYYIGTSPDIKLSPEPKRFYRSETFPVHIYELRPPWPRDIGATLEGYKLWQPQLAPEPAPEPSWAQEIRVVPLGPGRAKVEAQPPIAIHGVKIGTTVFPAESIRYVTLPPKRIYITKITAFLGLNLNNG